MNTTGDLILIGALAAVWLGAGLLADGLPLAGTASDLGRRATLLSRLVGAGVAAFVAVFIITALFGGDSGAALLPAVPALVVLIVSRRRLAQLRRAAAAFATAPLAPLPPALRAAAAHPLIAVPLQVTALAAVVALAIAGVPGAGLAEIATVVVGVAVVAMGLRHAARHSRLSGLAVAPIRRAPRELSRLG